MPLPEILLDGDYEVGKIPVPHEDVTHMYAPGSDLVEPVVLAVIPALEFVRPGIGNLDTGFVDDADVHVLLAMRDDFLFHIHDHAPLTPILDGLTLLGAPSSESLRLAVVEPAKRLGFSFENEDLPGEMVAEVESERGALPLLAFAVARLWDERDRKDRLLTIQAYREIGGVGGALGQHAEATLKAIGDERLPIVREIFPLP